MKPDRITYKVACTGAESKVVAIVTPDRTNHSVHVHFFGKMLSTKPTRIQVKRANKKFPEASDDEIVRHVVTRYGPIAGLQVKNLSRLKGNAKTTMAYTPTRVIVRFKK